MTVDGYESIGVHEENVIFTLGSTTSPAVKLLKSCWGPSRVSMGETRFTFLIGGGHGQCGDLNIGEYFACKPNTFKRIAPGYPDVTVDDRLLAGSECWTPEVIEVWMCT